MKSAWKTTGKTKSKGLELRLAAKDGLVKSSVKGTSESGECEASYEQIRRVISMVSALLHGARLQYGAVL